MKQLPSDVYNLFTQCQINDVYNLFTQEVNDEHPFQTQLTLLQRLP